MAVLGLVLGVIGAVWLWRVGMEAAQRRLTSTNPVLHALELGAGLLALFGLITLALSPAFLR